jgi:protein-disulfide isomerase
VTDLRSAPLPPVTGSDHVRGPAGAPLIVEYASFECHFCRMAHLRLDPLALRRAFRHFPVKSKHPRAWPAACAAEAAGLQGRFWDFHDSLYADQARLEDPHLWARAEALGLDVGRFDSDRRSESVAARVKADFSGAVRAGVVTTPALFGPDGSMHSGAVGEELVAHLASLA